MNFEDYLSYCTMSKAVIGVLLYSSVLIQISLAASASPCGGVRGRFICDDSDPQVFHICMGNQKYTNRCPGDLHYNVRTQTCDWPKAVNCVEEARQHARRTSSGEIKVPDVAGTPEEINDVESNEDILSMKNENKKNSPINTQIKKLKPSFDQNPKVQNKQLVYPNAMDDYTVQQDNVFTKSEEVELPMKVNNDESGSSQMAEINTKNRSVESKDTLDSVPIIKKSVQKEQLNESTLETTTPGMLAELSPSRTIENELAGHMIETYKANETPEVFLYTRPVPRQRNKRPSMSPYKKSPIVNTTRQPITPRRPVTSTASSRQLTTSTPPTQRQPVTTSRSPFRKTTVVYHPFLANRTKPDYREYAPQLTTRRPPDNRQSRDRSKFSPQISAAPYRSATNYADDITDTPKWYELGEDKKSTASKPESNSYGNRIGKSVSKNSIERESEEVIKDLDYTEDYSEKPLTSTKSSSLSWVKSSTNSYTTTGQTFPAPDALEKVRNALRSRNLRDHRLRTTTEAHESLTTPFAEEVNKNMKRFKPKTPLAQAWINERKGHNFEDDYENQESGSPFKKNRWYSTERLSTTAASERVKEKGTSPQTRENTEVTKEQTSTTKSHSSKTPSWTYSKTSMYSTDARNIAKHFKGTTAINAAAALNDRGDRRQKVTEINSVQEVTPKASSKLPWWSMGTNRDTSVAPIHEHEVGEHQQNPFYRRAFLPRNSGARKPNYHTRTPIFDTDAASSDQDQEKGSLLYRPKDQPAKERSFDLLKVNSDMESERRFSLHRNYGPPINTAESEDRTFALHKAKNRATNQYSAAAAADRRPQANGAVNAPASSDQISIDATEELAKNIDDKPENKNPIEKYEFKKGKCSSSWCKLPDCRCVGSDIPGELDAKDIPQMVMLTFDDSINGQNMGYYKTIFNGTLKNPNGCPIKSTFYVSGDNSDYEMVRKMHKGGHEIASHTLSHRSPTTWWADAGYDNWEQEVVGMKKRLNEKSGVPLKEITGMRAPFLQVGGDAQYAMLKENKFRYDTSMVTGNLYVNNEPPAWPFTLDTPPDSKTCSLTPCPTRSYPGLWEVPLTRWYGSNKIACAMPDACTIGAGSKGSRKFIEDNFMRHYTTNRAPFGIFIHASWFGRKDGNIEGLVEFLASLADKSDVWVVTVSQALDWIQKPVRLSAINAIDSWMC